MGSPFCARGECLLALECGTICTRRRRYFTHRRLAMAKSQDKKRTSNKKTAQKSIKEKRAAKKAKRAEKERQI